MASKSKRRRRVLRASCILAALIIAGSSFAWFTSKDEVTNRLTANADYGVSIVESFVPPKNMLPGQQVNKDVYAVNTGTIGAFVKETVSGKLTYTYEKRVATPPTNEANTDYVKLNNSLVTAIDGATTNEAGGYLAYTTATDVELGPVNSATLTDVAQSAENADPADNPGKVEGTRWHPTKTGVYIFRRSYVPAVEDDTTTPEDETAAAYYTYAGYYYVAPDDDPDTTDVNESLDEGDYYKIVIGDDDFRAKDSVGDDGVANFEFDVSATQAQLGKNVTIDKDGKVTEGAVAVQYVKEVTKKDVTPTLTYHKTGSGADPDTAYLEATYTDSDNENSADYTNKQAALNAANQALQAAEDALLAATSQRAIDEVAYENALGAYNTAKSRYDQTKADYDYAKAMKEATDALYTAANNRAQKEIAKDQAVIAVENALKALKDEADKLATVPGTGEENVKFGDLLSLVDTNTVSFKSIFGGSTVDDNGTGVNLNSIINTYQNEHIDSNSQMLADVKDYRQQMYDKWEAIKTQSGKVKTALGKLQTTGDLDYTITTRDDGDQAQAYLADLKTESKKLETLLNDYSILYAALKTTVATATSVDENLLTALSNNTSDTIQGSIDTLKGRATSLISAINRTESDSPVTAPGLAQLVDRYETAYDNYIKQTQVEIPKADKVWEDAVEAYNKAVQNGEAADGTKGAAKIYQEAIQTEQMPKDANNVIHKNEFDGLTDAGASSGDNKWLTDNGAELVSYYSAEKVAKNDNNGDPTIDVSDDDYKTLWKTIGNGGIKDHMSTDPASVKAVFTPAVVTPGASQAVSTYVQPVNNGISAEKDYKQLKASPSTGSAQTLDQLKKALDGTPAVEDDPETAEDETAPAVEGLKEKMEDALATYNASKKAVTDAKAARDAKQGIANNAAEAAEAAAEKDESQISFIIYLDDQDPGLNWTSELGDNESAESAAFYYNYILEAGQTSDKLIDAVKLSPKVTSKDYKSLTFDLNVGLDSAQVTYEADQKTISAVAVNDNDAFNKTAEVGTTVEGKTPVTWSPAAKDVTTKKVYKVGPYELAAAPATLADEAPAKGDYVYSIVVDGKTYYGKKNTDGEKYYLYVEADNTDPENPVAAHVDTTKSVTLSVTDVAE